MTVVIGSTVANNIEAQIHAGTIPLYKIFLGKWHSISKDIGKDMKIIFLDSNTLIITAAYANDLQMPYGLEKLDNGIIILSMLFPTNCTLKFFLWLSSKDQIKIIDENTLEYKKTPTGNLDEDFPKSIILIREDLFKQN